MTKLRLQGDYNDPTTFCDECEASFTIFWHRKIDITKVNFCPFCGEEVEEVIDEMT